METVLRRLAEFDESGRRALDAIATMAKIAEAPSPDVGDVVQTMAMLCGFPARALNPLTGVVIRSDARGVLSHPDTAPYRGWINGPLAAGEEPALWIEQTGNLGILEAAILDAAAGILRSLRFAADQVSDGDDLARLLLAEDPHEIEGVLKRLNLKPETRCRAIARPSGVAQLQIVVPKGRVLDTATDADEAHRRTRGRVGIGTVGRAANMAESWRNALVALAFAAEETDQDPGRSVMFFDELGIWAQLHHDLLARQDQLEDVILLSKVIDSSPWAGSTLHAAITHSSLRLAAVELNTHHSTVQSRMAVLEQKLGWDIGTPRGRIRLSITMAARTYLLHPPETGRPRSMSPLIVMGDL